MLVSLSTPTAWCVNLVRLLSRRLSLAIITWQRLPLQSTVAKIQTYLLCPMYLTFSRMMGPGERFLHGVIHSNRFRPFRCYSHRNMGTSTFPRLPPCTPVDPCIKIKSKVAFGHPRAKFKPCADFSLPRQIFYPPSTQPSKPTMVSFHRTPR